MTMTRLMPSSLAPSLVSSRRLRLDSKADPILILATGLFLVVLLADAVVVALAAPDVAAMGLAYLATT